MYTFASTENEWNMNIFTATVVIMTMIFATVFVFVRHSGHHEMPDRRPRYAPYLMMAGISVVAADLFAGEGLVMRLPYDLILSISPMLLVTSSLWEEDDALRTAALVLSVQAATIAYYVLVSVGVLPMIAVRCFVKMAGLGAVFIALVFMYSIHIRIREVRLVIKHGNVWASLCVMVESIYVMSVLIYGSIFIICMSDRNFASSLAPHLISLLLVLEFCALGIRVANDSVFVIRTRHERRIVESMKLSHVEISSDSSNIEELYRNIYERVVSLFEKDRMYLNSELTINDIVKIVYTNKLYISRAISQYTGRNFCQFVNYYRVIHSIKLFRENPDLKVAELANQSGFNSSVSFCMAFRLYMSETPSDWCRKEKYKLSRKKK